MVNNPAMNDGEIDGDTEIYETAVAGLRKHIFGPAEAGIREKLRASDDVATDVGNMAFALVQQAAQQAEQAGTPMDQEMVIGAATEMIDDLLMVAEAMGLIETADDDALREDSMMSALSSYIQYAQQELGPEEQQAAQQMLQQMQADGTVDDAASLIAQIGARQGVDPFADDDQPAVDAQGRSMQPPQQRQPMLMQA